MSGYIGTSPKKIGRGWIKIPSKNILDYIVTKDTSFSTDPIKVYYEKISDEYVVTSDTEMQSGKTYYEVHKLFEYTNRSVKNAWVGDDNKVPQLVLKSTYQREYTADNSDLVPSGYVNGDNFIFVNPFNDNEIHVFGAGIYGETGMNKHYVFKRIDDVGYIDYHYEWIKMNDLPYNISGSGMVLRLCTIGNVDVPYIYLLGGTYNKRAAYKYELEGDDEWIQQESIPYDFYNGVAFSIDNDSHYGITLYGGSGGANIIYDAWFYTPGVHDVSDIGGWTRRSDSGSYVNLPINFTTAYGNAPYRDVIFGTNSTWQSCYAYIKDLHTLSIGAWYKLENPPESFKNAIILNREFYYGGETYYKTLIICENNMYYFSIEWSDTDSKYHAYYEPVPQDGSMEAFFLPSSNPLNNKSVSNDKKWLFCQDGIYYNTQYSYVSAHINFEPFWKLTYKSNENSRSQDEYTNGLPYIISQGACGGNYFIGGFNGRGICELTDSGIPRYTRSIPYEFINGQACVIDGIVHLFGGSNSKKTHCTFIGSGFTYLSDLPIDLTYGSVIGKDNAYSMYLFGDPTNDSTYKGMYEYNKNTDRWVGMGNNVTMWNISGDYIDNFEYVKVINCNGKPYYLDTKSRKMFKGSSFNLTNWQFRWTEIEKPLPIIDYESSRPCFVVDSSNVIHMIGGGSGNQRKKHYIFDTENESLGWQSVEDLPFNVKNGLALDLDEHLWIISDDSCEYIEINYNRYFD